MCKLKNHRIVKNIIKLLSFCVVLIFCVSKSFGYDVAPLNVLSNWADKVEKNMEINSTKGKAVIKDVYNTSLEQAKYLVINPMLDSIKATTKSLNDAYLCNLTDNDIINILFRENSEFKKNIRNLSLGVKNPTRTDMVNSCAKFMGCVLDTGDSRKIRDSLSYCGLLVNSSYLDQYKNSYGLSSLSKGNEGYEVYWNNSLSDSSYDILSDVYALAKILFDSPEEPTEIFFYDLPIAIPASQSSSENPVGTNYGLPNVILPFSPSPSPSVIDKDPYSPYYDTGDDSGENSGDTGDGGNGGDDSFGDGGPAVNGGIDDDFGNFLDENNYEENRQEGSEFLGNDCVEGFQIEGYRYADVNTFSRQNLFSAMTDDEYFAYIVDGVSHLSCDGNGYCDATWESDTCSDCIGGEGEINDPQDTDLPGGNGSGNSVENEQISRCFASCGNTPCTAKNCDRLMCYAKCLCVNLESSVWDPLENIGLSSAFKLKFCVKPVLEHKVVTTKKVNNLESVILEIYNVIQTLRNSGQLYINKVAKEYLDSSLQNNDFSKQLSFTIDAYSKVPQYKGSEKQEMDDQKELNTAMMENILGFETSTDVSGKGRNKYLVKGGTIEQGSLISTVEQNSSEYKETDLEKLQASLQTEHLLDIDGELGDFLNSNMQFWSVVKDSFESLRNTAESLASKK